LETMRRFVSWETAEEIVIELHATQLLPACALLSNLCRLKPMSLSKLLRKVKNLGQTPAQPGEVTARSGERWGLAASMRVD